MRIGISISSSHPGSDPRVGARNMVERARSARAAGLDSLFVGDHHVTPFPYYQNNAILGRMLAEWGDRPFGALYLLPLWHPVLLAEQVATLASLAEGPFIMQCGLGDHRQGEAMGIDMSKRVPMFEASLAILRGLWRGETVTESRFWNLQAAAISPQPPLPVEVWVGALVPAAIDRTARLAEGWLAAPSLTPQQAAEAVSHYRQACAEHQRQPQAVAIRKDIFIGSTSEEARKATAPLIAKGYRGIAESALLIGSSIEVAEQISALAEQGYTDVIVRNMSPDQAQSIATIERLAEVKTLLA
ncbi:MAG: LLM class flavin-dependent oxidoreductase [Pseudomonadales bacterium]